MIYASDGKGKRVERLGELTAQIKGAPAGHLFAKAVFALVRAKTLGVPLVETLAKWRHLPEIQKAAVAAGSVATADWGSSWTGPGGVATEWVELTNRASLWGAITARAQRIPFNTRAVVAASPTNATFVRPGGPLKVTALSLADTTTMARYKLGMISVLTRELFDNYGPATQANIVDRLSVAVSRGFDSALLDPDSAGVAEETPASLTSGVSPIGLFGSTAAGALTSVEALLDALLDAGSDLSRVILAMHPSTALAMSMLQGSNANAVFPRLNATGGDVAGIPVFVTASAQRSGSPPEKIVAAICCDRVVYADDNEMAVDASTVASLQMDDAPTNDAGGGADSSVVNLFQTQSVAIKVTRTVNFEKANSTAVAWATSNY